MEWRRPWALSYNIPISFLLIFFVFMRNCFHSAFISVLFWCCNNWVFSILQICAQYFSVLFFRKLLVFVHLNVKSVLHDLLINVQWFVPCSPSSFHAFSSLVKNSSSILSGWDATTAINQQICFETLDEFVFDVRRGWWRKVFRTNCYQPDGNGYFLLQQAPKIVRKSYRYTGNTVKGIVQGYQTRYLSRELPLSKRWMDVRLFNQKSFALRICPN